MRRRTAIFAWTALITATAALPARAGSDLFDAVRSGDAERVAALLDAQPRGVESLDARRRTVLHVAADALSPKLVALLVQRGAAVDAQDSDGRTALHAAILARAATKDDVRKRAEVVRQLCSAGASQTLADAEGLAPLHLAALKGRAELLAALTSVETACEIKDRAGRTPLHYAALGGHVDVVAELISRGAHVSARDSAEETPLHLAARRFRADAAAALLERGADVDARNNDGQTPLIVAASQGPSAAEVDAAITALAERLIRGGAATGLVDRDGQAALDYAIRREHKRLAELLRKQGGGA